MTTIGRYGMDAPYVPFLFLIIGSTITVMASTQLSAGDVWSYIFFAYGILFLLSFVLYMHTTLRGKFAIWQSIFDRHSIPESAHLLDLGCGRGAVLLSAAKQMSAGSQAVGIDLWKKADQSGNDINVAKRNAALEGVADKVQFVTGDMTNLPFDDDSFDYVTAGFSIHNIKQPDARKRAIEEAHRVLRPGGTMVIADFRYVNEYVNYLRAFGTKTVETYGAGWNGWWGGPWARTHIVVAKK